MGKIILKESDLRQLVNESINRVLNEAHGHHHNQGFDPKHRANSVKLGYDPNLRYGDDFVKNGGNFMVVRNGRQYYVSRNTSVSLYAFARDSKGQWCILANERGKGGGRGLYNVTCGFVDMAPNGKPEETLEQAACREAFEENGVKIDPSKLVMMGVNSKNTNINASFYTVIPDRTIEQMPTSTAGAEGGEVLDTRWIPLSEVNKYKFAFNQNAKIPAIAKKALGNYEVEGDKRVETLIALLKNKIGNDQEGQYLLSQIIKELTKKKKT
jgi:8-oxo-dGTP pyrophosphatase MutT (NUDIX family)